MKKTILIYGLIAGLVVSALMLFMVHTVSHCDGGSLDYDNSMLLGYASMLLAFSMVFVGIRNYRDKYNGGVISFGRAFKTGLFIVLIASTLYVIAWQVDYRLFLPDFAEKYGAHMIEKLQKSGASAAAIDKQTKEMAEFARMYRNPFFNILMTYLEILPVGLAVALLSALILKRKQARGQGVPAARS